MNKAYLLIGGNIGNREKNLDDSIVLLGKYCGQVLRTSSIYETAAWGNTEQASFLNRVLELRTKLDADELMKRILEIETIMGRKRMSKWEPRIIDIDILFFNLESLQTDLVTVPHPQLQFRRFVLIPMNELAPGLVHPVLHQTVEQLLNNCTDTLDVKKIN